MPRKAIAAAVLVALQSVAAFCFAEEDIRYTVKLRGVSTAALRREMRSEADTVLLRRRRPRSVLQLRRRIERDVLRFETLLRSYGYYSAEIEYVIEPRRRRRQVVFLVDKGPQFRIGNSKVVPADAFARELVLDQNTSGLVAGQPAIALDITRAAQQIAEYCRQHGYPFAAAAVKEVVVDHALRSVDVLFSVEAGTPAVFGTFEVSGLEKVRRKFVAARIKWQEGDPYDSAVITATRDALAGSGLFSVLRFEHADETDADGRLAVHLDLRERAHRSVALGTGYHSDDGMRASAAWEHRNLRGGGERLMCDVQVTEYSYGAGARLRIPAIARPGRFVIIRLQGGVEKPDAFESRSIAFQSLLETPLGSNWTFGRGLGVKYADVRDEVGAEHYNLLYIPLLLDGTTVNNPLDPHRGMRWFIYTAPYVDTLDSSTTFLKSRTGVSYYRRIARRPALTAAARCTAGSIVGTAHSVIPADERFYAGGGGSVRGYAYQSVGPLYENGKPRGGRSYGLLSAELRWRVGGNWGLVAFADGGMVDLDGVPFAGDSFFRGVGGGMRYFTPVGPLRADVAVPLDKRDGIDDSFQVYVSLGQAF